MKKLVAGLSAASMMLCTGLPMAFASTSASVQQSQWFNANMTVAGKTVSVPKGFTQSTESYLPIYYLDAALAQIGYKAAWNGSTHTWNVVSASGNQNSFTQQSGDGNTAVEIDGKLLVKVNSIVKVDPSNKTATTYVPATLVQSLLKTLGAGTWDGSGHTLDVNSPNTITTAVSTNGSVTVTFSKAFAHAPSGGEFVVIGSAASTTSTVSVSKVDMSADRMTATLTIPEIPPTSGKPVPHYTVSYLGGPAVAAYERVVAVIDGKIGEVAKTVSVGETLTMSGVSDQCKPMPSITFVSDNTSVATVTADGTVTALAPGVAHIQATDANGYNANVPFTLTVK